MPKKKSGAVAAQPTVEIEDEVDRVAEETGEGAGTRRISEDDARKLGGMNAEAVQSNRRRAEVLDNKRAGVKHVPWGESNACLLYDDIIQLYPATALDIHVIRETGTPATWYLQGKPATGRDLYERIKNQCHGRAPEATYMVNFRDTAGKFDRGRGRVTFPSTEQEAPPPPPAAAPPGFAPFAAPPGYAPIYAPPTPTLTPAPAPASPELAQLSGQVATLASVVQQLLQRSGAAPGAVPPPGPPAPPAAAQAAIPGIAPPPGYVIVLTPTGQVLVPASQIALAGVPPPMPAAAAAPAPAAAPKSPEEQLTSAFGFLKTAMSTVEQVQKLAPTPAAAAAPSATPEVEPEPTKMVEFGDIKAITNTEDGSIRWVETGLANAPRILDWFEKQQAAFRQAHGQPGAPPSQLANGSAAGQSIPSLPK